MTAANKSDSLTIEEFEVVYEGTRCQFHEGEVWDAQATTLNHSDFMGAMTWPVGAGHAFQKCPENFQLMSG